MGRGTRDNQGRSRRGGGSQRSREEVEESPRDDDVPVVAMGGNGSEVKGEGRACQRWASAISKRINRSALAGGMPLRRASRQAR
ncbi:MAG TPA: hypothetical protein VGE19_15665 [Pseudoxanthomonas sp.]